MVPYVLQSNSQGNASIPKITKYVISDQKILWATGIHDLTQINFKYHEYTLSQVENTESEVRAVTLDHNRNYWDGFTSGYLKISNDQHQKLGYITPNGQLSQTPVQFSTCGIYALYEDSQGYMWIGTKGDGLYF